ncbi:MAG: ABC transporter permease, partial [Oscillospiraceae bacterium]
MSKISEKLKKLLKTINSNGQLKWGCIILLLIIVVIIFTPFLTRYSPYEISCDMLLAPNSQNLLGTDGLGKDVFSMILYGARTSIIIGLVSALISGVLGTFIGGIAGFIGGKTDKVISEIINIFLMIPTFFLILMIVAMFGSSMFNVMLVIGFTSWPSNARLMRVQALSLKERTFVKSAIASGENNMKILFNYIIPNGIYPIISNTTLSISGAILTEASLSFLG